MNHILSPPPLPPASAAGSGGDRDDVDFPIPLKNHRGDKEGPLEMDASVGPAHAMLTSGVTHPQVTPKRAHTYHSGHVTKLFESALGVEDGAL